MSNTAKGPASPQKDQLQTTRHKDPQTIVHVLGCGMPLTNLTHTCRNAYWLESGLPHAGLG